MYHLPDGNRSIGKPASGGSLYLSQVPLWSCSDNYRLHVDQNATLLNLERKYVIGIYWKCAINKFFICCGLFLWFGGKAWSNEKFWLGLESGTININTGVMQGATCKCFISDTLYKRIKKEQLDFKMFV